MTTCQGSDAADTTRPSTCPVARGNSSDPQSCAGGTGACDLSVAEGAGIWRCKVTAVDGRSHDEGLRELRSSSAPGNRTASSEGTISTAIPGVAARPERTAGSVFAWRTLVRAADTLLQRGTWERTAEASAAFSSCASAHANRALCRLARRQTAWQSTELSHVPPPLPPTAADECTSSCPDRATSVIFFRAAGPADLPMRF
mmetsp:Transcript_33880/g.77425  ORF Transcript_33880/g.77425 Transcript_33880/m.77425 type:complete len:201 (+) Transcript_33880:579-1181(+)